MFAAVQHDIIPSHLAPQDVLQQLDDAVDRYLGAVKQRIAALQDLLHACQHTAFLCHDVTPIATLEPRQNFFLQLHTHQHDT